jgi:hypothetical protein
MKPRISSNNSFGVVPSCFFLVDLTRDLSFFLVDLTRDLSFFLVDLTLDLSFFLVDLTRDLSFIYFKYIILLFQKNYLHIDDLKKQKQYNVNGWNEFSICGSF